jgi:ABC-type lipoprotein export system ATPase subunit
VIIVTHDTRIFGFADVIHTMSDGVIEQVVGRSAATGDVSA